MALLEFAAKDLPLTSWYLQSQSGVGEDNSPPSRTQSRSRNSSGAIALVVVVILFSVTLIVGFAEPSEVSTERLS